MPIELPEIGQKINRCNLFWKSQTFRQDTDPIEAREGTRAAKQAQESAKRVKVERERWTLARCARDSAGRVFGAGQWRR